MGGTLRSPLESAAAAVLAPAKAPYSVRRLAEQIRHHVVHGGFSPGDRYLSVREVAERWQISPVTAHRTVRQLAEEGVLDVRVGAGTFVGAVVSTKHKDVLVQTVQVFIPSDPDMRERVLQSGLQMGVMDTLPQASVHLHVLPHQRETEYLDGVLRGHPALPNCVGSLLFRVPRGVRVYFCKNNLAAVVVGHVESDIRLPAIDRDQRMIAEIVAQRLLGQGHRRIGLLMRDSWNPGDDQLAGALQARLAAAALGADALQIRSMAQEPSLIRATVSQLLSCATRPTALVCRTDLIALNVLEAVLDMGMQVPVDVAVVCVGAGIHSSLANARVPITTTSSDDRELGRQATRLLLDIANGDQSMDALVELRSTLIERQSG